MHKNISFKVPFRNINLSRWSDKDYGKYLIKPPAILVDGTFIMLFTSSRLFRRSAELWKTRMENKIWRGNTKNMLKTRKWRKPSCWVSTFYSPSLSYKSSLTDSLYCLYRVCCGGWFVNNKKKVQKE